MSKVAKATLGLMIATMLAKVLGFGRELILASAYGASIYSDAYITSMNIPLVVLTVIGSTIATVFIPIYNELDYKVGEKESLNFTNNVFNIIIIFCILLTVVGLIFTEDIVKIFAIGFEGHALKIAINFTKIIIIASVFIGLSYLLTSYLQLKESFIILGLITIPRNIIIIASIILSLKHSPYIMIIGTLFAFIVEFLIELYISMKKGYKYKLYVNIKDKHIKKAIYLMSPVLIGVAVNQLNAMIDRTLASTLSEGSISALNYANKLNGFVSGLFIASIVAVIYPMLSRISCKNNRDEFINSIVKSINCVILLVLPISIGAIVLATPIVRILFERGEFDAGATSMTAIALIMYSIGMVAFGLRDILGKVFYSLQDTKTPMINGVLAMSMNIVLNIILVRYLEIAGLSLATSISAIICIFLLFNSLNKKIGYFGQDMIIKTTLKSIVSSLIMGIVTYFGYDLISSILGNGFIYEVISLFASILLGSIVYGALVIVLKVEEVSIIMEMINKKILKKVA